jgi:hypothetical protein
LFFGQFDQRKPSSGFGLIEGLGGGFRNRSTRRGLGAAIQPVLDHSAPAGIINITKL